MDERKDKIAKGHSYGEEENYMWRKISVTLE